MKYDVIKPQPTPGDTEWFTDDRFGLFIHWGLYSLAARHEKVKLREKMDDQEYKKYFEHFDPDLYNPDKWAKIAAETGIKYCVITTKHHEGFCLWDSDFTDYKVTNTPIGKDLIKPFVEAFRRQNIKIGFYYSLWDWHHPEYTVDQFHPMSENEEYVALDKSRDMKKYARYLRSQVKELLTRFGKIDIIWFDNKVHASDRFPGKGREEWESEKMIKMVRELQPGIIINDRLGIDQDVKTAEAYAPPEWLKSDVRHIIWESCQTFAIDGSWGYLLEKENWMSVDVLIKSLIDTVSKGGNFLINVGPTARGEFDYRSCERVKGIGEWMKRHGRSIYGCTQAPETFITPKNCNYTYNPKTNRLYLHILSWPLKHLYLEDMADKVEYAQFLNDASEVKMKCGLSEIGYGARSPITDKNLLVLEVPAIKTVETVPVIELFLR